MEQRIQYATTDDGVRVAFATSGEGQPLVSIPAPPDNHLQLEWENPGMRENVLALSRHHMLVRFDARGSGLSDRSLASYTLDERLLDMEAVVEKLGLERFDILSGSHGNQLSVAFAVRHPAMVRRIVAVDPFVNDWMDEETIDFLGGILDRDFKTFTEVVGAKIFGWGNEEGPRFSAFFREAVNQGDARIIYDSMKRVDLAPLLPRVNAPVLVLRHHEAGGSSLLETRRFAALLPDASVAVIEGRPLEGGTVGMRRFLADFLGTPWDEPQAPPSPEPTGVLRAIMFTDIENHTPLMQRLGDTRGRAVIRAHDRITRDTLAHHEGAEVKATGDGFLASFISAQRALDCAIALQRALAANADTAELRVRIGVNAGEPIAEDGDLFGQSVIAASRIAACAQGGEILVADVVRLLAAGKGFQFTDRGEMELRGLEEPVRLRALAWE